MQKVFIYMFSGLQTEPTEVTILYLPVKGIKINATATNQASFLVTSAIAHSADNLFQEPSLAVIADMSRNAR